MKSDDETKVFLFVRIVLIPVPAAGRPAKKDSDVFRIVSSFPLKFCNVQCCVMQQQRKSENGITVRYKFKKYIYELLKLIL